MSWCGNAFGTSFEVSLVKGASLICFLVFFMAGLTRIVNAETHGGKLSSDRTIVDQAGRTVHLPRSVKRVLTTYRPATMTVYALGGYRTHDVLSSAERAFPIIRLINPNLDPIMTVGSKKSGVNIESVAALKPDVVLLYPTVEGRNSAEKLDALHIAAVVIDPESPGKLFTAIHLVGDVLGLEVKADELIDRLQAVRDRVSKGLAGLPATERKSVYYAASSSFYSTASNDMMQYAMIEQAGGRNLIDADSGGWATVSAEQLIVWKPEVIVLSRTCTTTIAELYADPRFSSIPAIAKRQIYRFPCNLQPWDYPSPETILGILWLSVRCYPERFSDVDLLAIVNEYYLQTYGKSFSEFGGDLEETNDAQKR